MNIFIGSLPFSVKDEGLREIFEGYGEVASARVISDKFTGRSKGFGFVEMETDEEANNAIANLNETEIQGRKIIVNQSQPRPAGEGGGGGFKKRSGGFGGGNRGGGSRGGYGGGGNRGGYGGGRESRDY